MITAIINVYDDVDFLDNIARNVHVLLSFEVISEVIIWDDGSSLDFKKELSKICDVRARILGTTDNHGAYTARHLAAQSVSSPYLWFIDSDDEVLCAPDEPGAPVNVYDFIGSSSRYAERYESGCQELLFEEIINGGATCALWNKIISTPLFISLPKKTYRNGDDLYASLILTKGQQIIHFKTAIIKYIVRNSSLSRTYTDSRLPHLGLVTRDLRREKIISLLQSLTMWKHYVFLNYARGVLRYNNPLLGETLGFLKATFRFIK